MQEKRVFIAIKLEPQNLDSLAAIQKKWLEELALKEASPVPKENLHLTLHFISRIPDYKLDALIERLDRHQVLKTFSFTLNRFAAFPSRENARVLALHGQPGNSPLSHLFHRIEEDIKNLNLWIEDRLFLPHISLFRVKNLKINNPPRTSSELVLNISQFAIYESRLEPKGAKYEVLREWSLSHLPSGTQ